LGRREGGREGKREGGRARTRADRTGKALAHPFLSPSLPCPQTPTLIAYSGYTEADVFPIAVLLSKWAHETTQTQSRRLLNAVKKKFSSSKWSEVAEADHLRLPVS
jgi:hypothetical protein